MFWLLLVSLLFGLFFYIEAIKFSLPGWRWAIAGLLFGPICIPLLWTHQKLNLKRSQGFNESCLQA
ncbi:hypothetical protein ACVFI8_01960 [Agarivorans sp. MS3-6]|uniref:hypothetical protein n=1 Tax=Agarivorans sp. TSD2052 TaxID=2937286 RepID=UPI0020106BFE|nr:hypothetical protein [Agarivorans sp. TSD2052]UPW20212.1 hypothetical protein M0C34_08090 [Agarivorans sp. TSD2052]